MSTRPDLRHPTAVRRRAKHPGQVVQARRRESEAVVGAVETGAVRDRRHLDRRLGAVGEGVVHLGIEVARCDLLVGPAEEAPHGIRGGIAVTRLEVHPLAGRGHLEAGGPRPVDQLADQCRLVAVGHRIDQALRPRLLGEDRPDHDVRLDVDHHQVLPGIDRLQRVACPEERVPRRLDHALDLFAGEHRVDAVGDEGRAIAQRLAGALRAVALFGPADARQRLPGLADIEVGHSDNVVSRNALRLRQHHGAELARPDQADPDRPASGYARCEKRR